MRKAMAKAEAGELVSKREQRAAEEAARLVAEQQVRLGAYLTGWIDSRTRLRENTRFGYRNIVRLHVTPTLGDVPLADLTTRQVRDLLEQLAQPQGAKAKVRTAATLARIRSLLSGALQDAVADGLVPVNVARGVRLPESAAASRAVVEVFTPAQLTAFLTAADKTPFGPVLRFIAATGVRRGEAVGLLWDAVDLDEGLVTIRRSLTKVAGQVRVDKPKTRKGERRVPLDRDTVAFLRELRRGQAEESMRWGRAAWNPDGYVFVRADGTHLLPDSVTQAAKRITTALGLPDLHVHSLRHSYATAALAVGVDVKVVSDVLGHSTTTLTQNVYQHTPAAMMADAAELIAALRRGSVADPVASGGAET
jgi:integrase